MSHVMTIGRNCDRNALMKRLEDMWNAGIHDVLFHHGEPDNDGICTNSHVPIRLGDGTYAYEFSQPSETYAAIKALQAFGFGVYVYCQPLAWHQLAGDGYGQQIVKWFRPMAERMPGLGIYFDGIATHRYMGWWEIVSNPYWCSVPIILHGSVDAAEGGREYWSGFAGAVLIGETQIYGPYAEALIEDYTDEMRLIIHPNFLGSGGTWLDRSWPTELVNMLQHQGGGLKLDECELTWAMEKPA